MSPWVGSSTPQMIVSLSNIGFDFLLYDMEHTPIDRESVANMIMFQVYQKECVPLVRIPWNDIWLAKQMLDVGAYGLVIPWVNTREEAIKAVSYCKYPPMEVRGCAPGYAAFQDTKYIETANAETMVIIQIETETAMKNLDDILSVKGIDATCIGPLNMAMSSGWYGKEDRWDNTREAMKKVIEKCKKYGVAPGMALNDDMIEEGIQLGIKMVFAGIPINWVIASAKKQIEIFNKFRK